MEFTSLRSGNKYKLVFYTRPDKKENVYLQRYSGLSGNYTGESLITINEEPTSNKSKCLILTRVAEILASNSQAYKFEI